MKSRAHSMRGLSVVLLLPLLLAIAASVGMFSAWQEKAADLLFTHQSAPTNIAIIDIDERTIKSIGQWPWPRAVFGRLVRNLDQAAVIGIDVNFKEPSRLGIADDAAFAQAIKEIRTPVIVTAETQPDGTLSHPIEPIQSVTSDGFPNLIIGNDGTARIIRLKRGEVPSFALEIAKTYTQAHSTALPPVPETPTRIAFVGPDQTFTHFSALDVLDGKIPSAFIANKVVLIGATARDLQDFHETPFGITSGVEIQANIVHTVIQGSYFHTPWWWTLVTILLFGCIALWITTALESMWRIVVALAGLLGLYTVVAFLAFDQFIILDILYPNFSLVSTAIASMSLQYVATKQERKFIEDTFSRYLAPQVIQELIHDPSKIKLGGQKSTLSILFSDVRSFTTLSEKMSPEHLTQFLNRYLSAMTNIILDQHGVIDKYIGDAIMAFWGAPLSNKDHARDAVASALAMVASLKKFNEANAASGDPAIDIGIGINSGDVTVGNMGSEKRFDYTVMGDNVNLASRLEGLTKEYGINIIISGATAALLSSQEQKDLGILLREIDRVQVKGKKQGVIIFQVVAEHRKAAVQSVWNEFHRAREHYYAGQWDQAIQLFEKILVSAPADGPSKTLLARCIELKANPPSDWQGVYQMTHK